MASCAFSRTISNEFLTFRLRGVLEEFKNSENASLETVSGDSKIISFDLFESELVFSEFYIHDLFRDVFCPKKCSKKLCFQERSETKI